jgi:glycosyltransferase involved in cell wall biosynthesis
LPCPAGYRRAITIWPVPRVLLAFEPPDGGVAEHVAQLALRLAAHGFEPEVAGPAEALTYPRLAAAGVPVHRLPLVRGLHDVRSHRAAVAAIERLLAARSFDVVHAHSARAGVLARVAAARQGTPAVYSPHCFAFVGPVSRARRAVATTVERRLARRTAAIVCACEAERQWAVRREIGPPERLQLVYYGVEECPNGTPADPVLSDLRRDGPLAGAVSVLRTQKRLDLLLEATPAVLERVPDARVAIVGDGPLRDQLHDRARRLGLDRAERFAFLPFQPPAARYLKALDVYVLPSAWEALPIGALEALACGVPQIATDVEGTAEAVEHNSTGLLLPPDASGLADSMVALLGDERRRRAMSEASRARQRERFGVDRMVAETARVYEGALAG